MGNFQLKLSKIEIFLKIANFALIFQNLLKLLQWLGTLGHQPLLDDLISSPPLVDLDFPSEKFLRAIMLCVLKFSFNTFLKRGGIPPIYLKCTISLGEIGWIFIYLNFSHKGANFGNLLHYQEFLFKICKGSSIQMRHTLIETCNSFHSLHLEISTLKSLWGPGRDAAPSVPSICWSTFARSPRCWRSACNSCNWAWIELTSDCRCSFSDSCSSYSYWDEMRYWQLSTFHLGMNH